MEFHIYTFLIILINVNISICMIRDLSICQDDFTLKPPDGLLKENTFTWLGYLQYVHVMTGLLNPSKAPRVVLIHRQFVLGTAADFFRLPKNYKIGNVVFGDYERDEQDCQMTLMQLKMGEKCPRAYLEVPISETTAHPEFSRFGVGNSMAVGKLIRPVQSEYFIPICLPTYAERQRKRGNKIVMLIDYISTVPRDFDQERMGKKTLKLYTHKECRRHRKKANLGSEGATHVLCTSGCGVRPGAPIASHSPDGEFELIGLSAGYAPCTRSGMRRRLNDDPPIYIDVFPYVTWIVNIVAAHVIPKAYPSNFKLVDGRSGLSVHKSGYLRKRREQQHGWRARTYLHGNFCFKSRKVQERQAHFFYSEKFAVHADPPAKLHVLMKLSAGVETTILCARMLFPNRQVVPIINGVGGYNMSLEFTTDWFPYVFFFTLGLTGKNTTRANLKEWILERHPGAW
ncbi:uncharacterized protein LOC134680558 [Cydia fagiglandana]|uniref:uncharacterized protein LOC134680558 n=1 Tax=Cydia fagiglandana TaxID=1458189 RepID=UPI002FEE0A34